MKQNLGTIGSAHVDAILNLINKNSCFGRGSNNIGQLASASLITFTEFMEMAGLPNGVKAIKCFAGQSASVIIGDNGIAYGTGWNNGSLLTGTGNRTTLTPLTGLPNGVNAVEGTVGSVNTLIIGSDGKPYGVGRNISGQLTDEINRTTLTPMTGLPGGVNAVKCSIRVAHSLILGSNGIVYGTGENGEGQLTGTALNMFTLTPVTSGLPGGVTAIDCFAGSGHTIIIGSNGIPYGTGSNGYWQLTDTVSNKTTLTPMVGLPGGVTAIGGCAGENTTIILGSDGVAYGAGWNDYSELATTYGGDELSPMMGLPVGVSAISCGASYNDSYVLGSDGILYGCGRNNYNQISSAAGTVDVLTPVDTVINGTEYFINKYSAGDRHLVATFN